MINDFQIDQSTTDPNAPPHPSYAIGTGITPFEINGLTYFVQLGTTNATNHAYVVPLGADWEYASSTNNRVVTPVFNLSNVNKWVRAYELSVSIVGAASGSNLGVSADEVRMYYRTAGISDNTGVWTLLADTGSLSNVAAASQIQFMFEFRTICHMTIPTRLWACGVVYDDISTDTHYQPSATYSSGANKRFAWRFATAFGGSVPALRVRLYDAVTGGLLVDDNTATPAGTFERSVDGSSWTSWNNTDKGNETTYLRYTSTALGDSLRVRALLTQN